MLNLSCMIAALLFFDVFDDSGLIQTDKERCGQKVGPHRWSGKVSACMIGMTMGWRCIRSMRV